MRTPQYPASPLAPVASRRIAAQVFDHSHEAILISDHNNRIVDVNPAFTRITGYSREEVLGLSPSILSSGRHSREYYDAMHKSIEQTGYWRGEIWNRRKNGEEFAEILTISRVRMDDPADFYYVATFSDITQLKNHARELDRVANFDKLTTLPNRHLLEQRLRSAQSQADRDGQSLVVCYLDLDDFKTLNDQLGLNLGNQVLRLLGKRLTRELRCGDTLARIGGDEFVLLLRSRVPEGFYQHILNTVSRPIPVGNQHVRLSACLGITRYPDDRGDAEALIRHADLAMYTAKEKGHNQIHFFDPLQDLHRRERRDQLTEIDQALEQNQFQLFYQPQIRISDGQLTGFEALLRWNHPARGKLSPADFLHSIDNSHLEIPVGCQVLTQALDQLSVWKKAGQDLSVSINISPRHLLAPSFTDLLETALGRHPDLDPGKITLEILESTALEDTVQASKVLSRCRELGLRIALDDFGTGFSSLTYLRSLPVDVIKIDQSFVRSMLTDPSDQAIVESILFLTRQFSRSALAEGVETSAHMDTLKNLGCDYAQGYGIARPMPAQDVLPWIEKRQTRQSRPRAAECTPPQRAKA